MGVEDLEALEETLEILGDPSAMLRLAQVEHEIANGASMSVGEIRAAIAARATHDS